MKSLTGHARKERKQENVSRQPTSQRQLLIRKLSPLDRIITRSECSGSRATCNNQKVSELCAPLLLLL